jgi:hypothetical protein
MTKIVLKSEAAPVFEILRTPLSVLLYPGVIAYYESQNAIYLSDPFADLAVDRLIKAGVPIEVVKSHKLSPVPGTEDRCDASDRAVATLGLQLLG